MTPARPPVRVLSWNVRDLLGDPLAVHRVVRSAAADVVCLQEAPRRPGARLRLGLIERATGLRCVAGGRGAGGTAIFVAAGVRVVRAGGFRLPVRGRFERTRGACVADCRPSGGPGLAVASVHLPLDAAQRLDHAVRVREIVRRRGLPAVVAGDLNEPAGAPAWQALGPTAADPWPDAGPTYPARTPLHRLDAVLVGPGLRAEPAPPEWFSADDVLLASDHLPVLALITHPTPPRRDHARWS